MTDTLGPHSLYSSCAYLLDDGGATALELSDSFWSELSDGRLERIGAGKLVTCFRVAADWDNWERHPAGDEFLCLLEGSIDIVLEQEGIETVIELRGSGAFTLVPAGVWHTARVHVPGTLLFITPGRDTEHRPA